MSVRMVEACIRLQNGRQSWREFLTMFLEQIAGDDLDGTDLALQYF